MENIWLIRHGESEANAGGRTSDPRVIPLTPRGRLQAEATASLFTEKPFMIVSSRYLRARQTAQPSIDKFKAVPREEWDIHEFTYLSPNRFKDTTITDRKPHVEAYWKRCAPSYCDGIGAESFIEFIDRVDSTISKLKNYKITFCALFSHMQFIAAMLWRFANPSRAIDAAAMKDYKSFLDRNPIPNGAITEVRMD